MVTLLSSTSFTLEWNSPPEENRNGAIIKYQVKVEWNTNQIQRLETVFTNNRVTGLEPNTTYYYSVAAYTKIGIGPYSKKTAVTTKEIQEIQGMYTCQVYS